MALAVIDHKVRGRRPVRVAFDTRKLGRVVDMPSLCSSECSGPLGCVVRRGMVSAKEAVATFALAWSMDHTLAHPDWVVYVYEVLQEGKARRKAAPKARRPARRAHRQAHR